jgi:hypothetical protein
MVRGANDNLFLPNRVSSLAELLMSRGIGCQLIVVPLADYRFDGYPNGLGKQLLEQVAASFIGGIFT